MAWGSGVSTLDIENEFAFDISQLHVWRLALLLDCTRLAKVVVVVWCGMGVGVGEAHHGHDRRMKNEQNLAQRKIDKEKPAKLVPSMSTCSRYRITNSNHVALVGKTRIHPASFCVNH